MSGTVNETLFIQKNSRFFNKDAKVREDLLILRKNETDRFAYLLFKRGFDIVFSSLLIVFVLSWLLPIIAIIIRLNSKGSVFFIQRRVGYRGKTFPCIKLRTMYKNKHAHSRQAMENDARITPVGNFLRKSNLDELPQFINVLLGHMSIVGPRPHMLRDCVSFSEVVETYEFRHLMRPGITGLAQIRGYRGPARNFESIFRRYQFDALYIHNACFWVDLRIMIVTGIQTVGYFVHKINNLFRGTRDLRDAHLRVVR